MGSRKRFVVAALLIASIVAISVAPATLAKWGSWSCVTGAMYGWGGWVSLTKSGNSEIVYAGWNYPAFYSGTWAWYKEYTLIWKWGDRSGRVRASHSEYGRALGWHDPPDTVRVLVRIRMWSDHGGVNSEAWISLKPDKLREMKELADRVGLTELLKRLFVLLVASGIAESAAGGAVNSLANIAMAFGTAVVIAKILVPLDMTCNAFGMHGDKVCTANLVGPWATLVDSTIYRPGWKFTIDDDAGCSGCILWWCFWDCQNVKEPMDAVGIAVLADPPQPVPNSTKYVIERFVLINGSTATVAISIMYPSNETAPITGEKTLKVDLGDKSLAVAVTKMDASKALADTDTIVVKGVPVAMPKPTSFVYDTILSDIAKKPVYSAYVKRYDPRLDAVLITYVAKIGEQQPPYANTLLIGGVAMVIIALIAIVALMKAPKAATSVIQEARRRFVRRRTQ